MALRITKAEREELRRLTTNANRKRRRNIRKGVPASALPGKFSFENIASRKELNQYKASARSFTNRYNRNAQYIVTPNGAVFTARDRDVLELQQRTANRVSERHRTRFDDKTYKLASERGQAPSAIRTVGQDRNIGKVPETYSRSIDTFRARAEYDAYLERLQHNVSPQKFAQRDTQLVLNYISSVRKVFGSDGDAIVSRLYLMDVDEFVELYYTWDIDIPYIYSKEAYYEKLGTLEAIILGE